MTKNRIAELETELRKIQEGALKTVQLEKSRLGNIYWDYDSETEARTRPYEGNDRQFVALFGSDLYSTFVDDHPELQEYWRAPMYCIDRVPDGYKEVCSNIHRGDFFGCGKTAQVGHVYVKITCIQCSLHLKHQSPSPAGDGGNYIKYRIGGDIGGHWCEPSHDDFTQTGHFVWLPSVERLLFAGFPNQAEELLTVFREVLRTNP